MKRWKVSCVSSYQYVYYILFLGVFFPTSPIIPPFKMYFYDVTYDTFLRFKIISIIATYNVLSS